MMKQNIIVIATYSRLDDSMFIQYIDNEEDFDLFIANSPLQDYADNFKWKSVDLKKCVGIEKVLNEHNQDNLYSTNLIQIKLSIQM